MGKKKAAEPAPSGRRAKRKRGFIRRSLGKLVFVGAIGAAAKYLGNPDQRKKVMGMIGR